MMNHLRTMLLLASLGVRVTEIVPFALIPWQVPPKRLFVALNVVPTFTKTVFSIGCSSNGPNQPAPCAEGHGKKRTRRMPLKTKATQTLGVCRDSHRNETRVLTIPGLLTMERDVNTGRRRASICSSLFSTFCYSLEQRPGEIR